MNVEVIGANDIRRLLPFADCIDAMSDAMSSFSKGEASPAFRLAYPLPRGDARLYVMPGGSQASPMYCAKLVSIHPRSVPAIQGVVALFDAESGAPLAILDGAAITSIRTAAASAMATRTLSRRDCTTLGLLGTGVQADSHLEAICAIRSVKEVRVSGESAQAARDFADRHDGRDVTVIPSDVSEVCGCDIVTAVTSSAVPVVAGKYVRAGAHVNLVGAHSPESREADSDLVSGARVFVDSRRAALEEAGDLLIPISEGRIGEEHIVAEIGEVQLGQCDGRKSDEEITIYKSLGVSIQDLYASCLVYERFRSGKKYY
jgi:ornithine cyclodeaminase/alanine dehydrogenase-like protein (mu-crystallin family)